jgi:hypothetical protein
MIQRRAKATGIETRIGNHTFRATGITAYLKTRQTHQPVDLGLGPDVSAARRFAPLKPAQ